MQWTLFKCFHRLHNLIYDALFQFTLYIIVNCEHNWSDGVWDYVDNISYKINLQIKHLEYFLICDLNFISILHHFHEDRSLVKSYMC